MTQRSVSRDTRTCGSTAPCAQAFTPKVKSLEGDTDGHHRRHVRCHNHRTEFAADLSRAAHAHIGAGLVFIGATVASHLVGRNVGTIFFLTVTLHPWDGATFATREGTIAQCDESTRAPGSSDIEVTGREASVPRHAQGQFDSRTS